MIDEGVLNAVVLRALEQAGGLPGDFALGFSVRDQVREALENPVRRLIVPTFELSAEPVPDPSVSLSVERKAVLLALSYYADALESW
jgi:hypothetical protein